ncbi:MAG TPA: hypothetical protein VF760_06220, partial [Xanthobacteraceae bacterium]
MFGERHLRRLLKSYQKYYNEARMEGRTRTQRLAPRFDQRIDGFRLTLEPPLWQINPAVRSSQSLHV